MKRKSIFILIAIVAVLALVLVGCSGKKEASGGSSESSSQSGSSGGLNNNLFDIPKDQITFGSNVDRDTALAEIPAEFFKGVGVLNSVDIWKDNISSFKYTVVLKFYVQSAEEGVKTIMDYYRSIGGTVEETGRSSNPYSVKFNWGESTEVKARGFEGQDYVDMQFSVVKE